MPLALGLIVIAIAASLFAALSPIQFSIVTVFLFAGPHNWLEVRYILGRLPARVGKLRGFFLLSLGGILGLTGFYAALPSIVDLVEDDSLIPFLYASWNCGFIVWTALLIYSRANTNPRFDADWLAPATLIALGLAFAWPALLQFSLVYLHPLMALVLLDRELKRSHRTWRPTYHLALACIPILLIGLWWRLGSSPDLPGEDPLTLAITYHSGATYFSGVSSHFLVAAHTFLEMVHYGVWVLLIPLVGMRSKPWELQSIPAARRGRSWSIAMPVTNQPNTPNTVILWVCFLADYETTRTVYFTVALFHVLAEIPFLLRMS